MKTKIHVLWLIFTIISFVLVYCSDNSTLPDSDNNYIEPSLYENLTNYVWRIDQITTKYGTHDPDEEVDEDHIARLEPQSRLEGDIQFTTDSLVLISNASEDYYLKHWNRLNWRLDDDFIYFKQNSGGFGYNIKSFDLSKMVWFIEGTGIESGLKSVKILEFSSN